MKLIRLYQNPGVFFPACTFIGHMEEDEEEEVVRCGSIGACNVTV